MIAVHTIFLFTGEPDPSRKGDQDTQHQPDHDPDPDPFYHHTDYQSEYYGKNIGHLPFPESFFILSHAIVSAGFKYPDQKLFR